MVGLEIVKTIIFEDDAQGGSSDTNGILWDGTTDFLLWDGTTDHIDFD